MGGTLGIILGVAPVALQVGAALHYQAPGVRSPDAGATLLTVGSMAATAVLTLVLARSAWAVGPRNDYWAGFGLAMGGIVVQGLTLIIAPLANLRCSSSGWSASCTTTSAHAVPAVGVLIGGSALSAIGLITLSLNALARAGDAEAAQGTVIRVQPSINLLAGAPRSDSPGPLVMGVAGSF